MELRDWPPTENRMPSLAHLDSENVLNVVLNSLVGDRGVQGISGRPLMVHLARLMDKTILSYEEARRELDRYVTAPRDRHLLSFLLRAQDHLETCIDALRRADAFAEALRRLEEAPPIPRPSPPHRTATATVKPGHLKRLALWATELKCRAARHYAEYLVRRGMEVMEGKHPVHPRPAPAMLRKAGGAALGAAACRLDVAVDQHGERRVIRNPLSRRSVPAVQFNRRWTTRISRNGATARRLLRSRRSYRDAIETRLRSHMRESR